ncbi:hypothetical protein [Rhodococcoides kroppenstedtii]|nr:hypothetical protein [Rhodococcus kroppenstedtii]
MSVRWDHFAPVDLQTLVFGLRLIRHTADFGPDPTPDLARPLDSARHHLVSATELWYGSAGRTFDDAAREAKAVFADLYEILELSECTCEDPDLGYRVLAAALADTVESMVRFLRTVQQGPPTPGEVRPDATTVLHLRRAAAELTSAIGAITNR